jgi:hypothetical protein
MEGTAVYATARSGLSIQIEAKRLSDVRTRETKTMNNLGGLMIYQIANDQHQELIRRAERNAMLRGYQRNPGAMAGLRQAIGGAMIVAGEWIHGERQAREIVAVDAVDCLRVAN